MLICGLNKTTLLDYPEHVAATIFTGGCNFRCPFCHNGDLVLRPNTVPAISEEELFTFLHKRKNILSGVCITGGEPTLQPDLKDFIKRIKSLGLLVKLDTNGYRPDVLKSLCEEGLVDYVAMDIKNTLSKYPLTVGLSDTYSDNCDSANCTNTTFDSSLIEASVSYLINSSIEYEFRTTVVKELHSKEDLIQIAQWLQGSRHYYLQCYQETDQIITPGFSAYPADTLKEYVAILQSILPCTALRGIE